MNCSNPGWADGPNKGTLWPNRRGKGGCYSNTGQETFNLCLGEFGKIGDSEEGLADAV